MSSCFGVKDDGKEEGICSIGIACITDFHFNENMQLGLMKNQYKLTECED